MSGGVRGIPIGRVFGIRIAIDYSWIFIVVLLTWSLAVGFEHVHPGWSTALAVGLALAASLLFFASVLLHKLAHSVVARHFGLPVSSITLFLLGGISNIEREPPSAKAEFWTAVVGPLTSIVLGIVLLWIASAAVDVPADAIVDPYTVLGRLGPAESLLMWLGPVNIIVGIFNLIPAFPLDGGRLLRSAIWASTRSPHAATRWASAIGQAVGWFFVFIGVAIAFGANVPFFGRGIVSGLWLAFIGWFLSSAAAQSWRRQLVHEIVEGLTVARLMRPLGRVIAPDTAVSSLVDDWLLRHEERSYPVCDESGRLLGIVTLADVRAAPRSTWPTTPVSRVMTPFERLVTTTAREDLGEALEKLAKADVRQLPVVDGQRLSGLLLRSDIARWIETHIQPRARTFAH